MSVISTREGSKLNLTVSSRTNTIALGDSIVGHIMAGQRLSITSAGAFATNQAIKSLSYARAKLMLRGLNMVYYSCFEDRRGTRDGKMITLVRFEVLFVTIEGRVREVPEMREDDNGRWSGVRDVPVVGPEVLPEADGSV